MKLLLQRSAKPLVQNNISNENGFHNNLAQSY